MSGLTPADIKAVFGRPPEQAIDYLKRKGFAPSEHWYEVSAAAHARAFTVARATQLDVLGDIRRALIGNMEKGQTLADFKKQLTPLLQAKGWWGQRDSDGVQLGSPRRLRTIYQTNLQSAFMAGRYASALEAADTHPYWMYVSVMDGLTRHSHAEMHGRVLRCDDPIWQHILPPNGFNCRCRFVALSEDAVKRRGLTVESSQGRIREIDLQTGINPESGEVFRQRTTVFDTTDHFGKPLAFHADGGFDGSPLQSHLLDRLLYDKAQRALGSKGGAAALAAVQDVLLHPVRLKGWEAFVEGARRRGQSLGHTMAFGVLDARDLSFAQSQGAPIQAGLLYMHDRNLAGLKGRRHQGVGDALSTEEFKQLPLRFSQRQGQTVLWDNKDGLLVYLIPTADGAGDFFKVVVRFARHDKAYGLNAVEDAATVFRITANAVHAMLGQPWQQRVR